MPTKEIATREEMLLRFSSPDTFFVLADSFYRNTLEAKQMNFLIENDLITSDGKMLCLSKILRLLG